MEINSFDLYNTSSRKSLGTIDGHNMSSYHLIRKGFNSEDGNHGYLKKMMDFKSPYLSADRMQMLSRITEKRLLHNKVEQIGSSIPPSVNIYKANSDDFKLSKPNCRKMKKSVLTLPNEPTPIPQIGTVSDMNESEYLDNVKENRQIRPKKKRNKPIKRQAHNKERALDFYNTDRKLYSEINNDFDYNSNGKLNHLNGDENCVRKQKVLRQSIKSKNHNPHDVWTVLRNINRFKFQPSPPLSQDSIDTPQRKKEYIRKRHNLKDSRLIEMRRTEEFAYISSFEVDNKSQSSCSPSSSFECITVIDKHDEFEMHTDLKRAPLRASTKRCDITKKTNKQLKCNNPSIAKRNHALFSKRKNVNQENDITALCTSTKDKDIETALDLNNIIKYDKLHCTLDTKTVSSDFDYDKTSASLHCTYFNNNSFSCHSGSDKVDVINDKPGKKQQLVSGIKLHKPEKRQLNGVTNVYFNKDERVKSRLDYNKVENENIAKKTPSKMTISATIYPKLTRTDIKRRLANIKYPLVILGKNQLNSPVALERYNPLQFDGLEKHIWPFMLEWCDTRGAESLIEIPMFSKNIEKSKTCTTNQHVNISPDETKRDLKNKITVNKNKNIQGKQVLTCDIKNSAETVKPTSIQQFKNKMMKYFHKRSSKNESVDHPRGGHGDTTDDKIEIKNLLCKDVSVGTERRLSSDLNFVNICKSNIITNNISHVVRTGYPWSKTKRANDFIDNILKKIKSGVYYCENRQLRIKNDHKASEASTQTEKICINKYQNYDPSDFTTKLITKCDSSSIPGFDNNLSALEIETINKNQITVKHCTTNLVLQFDVLILNETTQGMEMKQSVTCIPVKVTQSETKVFKCKTTILNAYLPAELCSLMPNILQNLINYKANILNPSICVTKEQPVLNTITELAHQETLYQLKSGGMDALCPSIYKNIVDGNDCFVDNFISSVNKITGDGNFAGYNSLFHLKSVDRQKISLKSHIINVKHLSSKFDTTFYSKYILFYGIIIRGSERNSAISSQIYNKQKINTSGKCTALELYNTSNKRIIPAFDRFSFISKIKEIFDSLQQTRSCGRLNLSAIDVTIRLTHNQISQDTPHNIIITNVYPQKAYDQFTNANCKPDDILPLKDRKQIMERTDRFESRKQTEKTKNRIAPENLKTNQRRKKYFKLYKKCKSMSNLSGERCSIPLHKISNLDGFLLALGPGKLLSNVLDGGTEKNILTSIFELKNWTTEITPTQALLVLLLSNKKETHNLIRFRPVLLQGIAVNRITRASELELEIEVIERENLNRLPQYDGVSYLTASVENQDNLFEELCWIAKTTASDYQRTFDDSCKKRLKLLLEKRKKLNPSYLRVMARYVGLGLLKTSK